MARNAPSLNETYDRPQQPAGADDRDAINADSIMRFIRRRYRICLAWILAGLCLSAIYAAVTPAYYTATASVLLEDQTVKASDAAVAGTDSAHSTYIETQVQVLGSDEVVARVVDGQHLADDSEFGGAGGGLRVLLGNYIRSLVGSNRASSGREPRYAAITRVRRGLSVRRVGVSDVVEIEFTSRDPVRSAKIVSSVIQNYINSRLDLQRSVHEETASHLQALLGDLRDKAFPAKPPEDAFATDPQSGTQTRARFREQQEWTDAYQALYGRLLRQALGDAGRDFSAANVRVITPAEPPLLASSRLILIIALTAASGGIGFGHALFAEMTDRRIRTLDELVKAVGSDKIMAVPRVKPADWRVETTFPAYLQSAYIKTAETVYDVASRIAIKLQDCATRRGGWIIGVVAPLGNSGASSIAVHLAKVVAEAGQRTLLLDANWRKRPTSQILLNSSQSRKLARGLCAVDLEGDVLDILVLRATQPTSELNASLSIVSTLDTMRMEYDCIIVDFSASEQTADIEAGASVVNEVVAVAEARRATTDALAGLLRKLPADKVTCVVLNKA